MTLHRIHRIHTPVTLYPDRPNSIEIVERVADSFGLSRAQGLERNRIIRAFGGRCSLLRLMAVAEPEKVSGTFSGVQLGQGSGAEALPRATLRSTTVL